MQRSSSYQRSLRISSSSHSFCRRQPLLSRSNSIKSRFSSAGRRKRSLTSSSGSSLPLLS